MLYENLDNACTSIIAEKLKEEDKQADLHHKDYPMGMHPPLPQIQRFHSMSLSSPMKSQFKRRSSVSEKESENFQKPQIPTHGRIQQSPRGTKMMDLSHTPEGILGSNPLLDSNAAGFDTEFFLPPSHAMTHLSNPPQLSFLPNTQPVLQTHTAAHQIPMPMENQITMPISMPMSMPMQIGINEHSSNALNVSNVANVANVANGANSSNGELYGVSQIKNSQGAESSIPVNMPNSPFNINSQNKNIMSPYNNINQYKN